jgi:hypothetical protein
VSIIPVFHSSVPFQCSSVSPSLLLQLGALWLVFEVKGELGASFFDGEERGGGAGVPEQGLHGPAAGAARGRGGVRAMVVLPGDNRRVRRDAAVPLHYHRHRHRRQQQPWLRRRRAARHRLGLRRHDLRARLLHRRHLRYLAISSPPKLQTYLSCSRVSS